MFLEESGADLKKELEKMGVGAGDILYIASDIKTLLFQLSMTGKVKSKKDREKALDELIDLLQEVLTEQGTLLFPVFSWEWCRGNGFDYKQTKGEVGTLANWVLSNRPDFVRTGHPIYSFMVWGKDAQYLKAMDNQDAWSAASPFYYLQQSNAKQLFFNIEAYQGFTFCHYVEQRVGVPYRHPKYFFGEYTDEYGCKEKRMYSMFVRDLEVDVRCGVRNAWLVEKGVAQQGTWENNVLTVVDLANSYPVLYDDMLNNEGKNTLTFITGRLDWSQKQTISYEVKGIEG